MRSLCLVFAFVCAPLLGEETVTARDGRTFTGTVLEKGDILLVRALGRDVYLSPWLVSGRAPAAALCPPVEYFFHEEKFLGATRGKLDLSVDMERWGQWSADGICTVEITDPKLGHLTITLALRKLTPALFEVRGVEYECSWSWPTQNYARLIEGLVRSATHEKDLKSVWKAFRFFEEYGDEGAAAGWLDRVQALAPDDPGVAAARTALEVRRLRTALAEAQRLVAREEPEKAAALLAPPGAEAVAAEPVLCKGVQDLRDSLARQIETLHSVRARLVELKVPRDDLSVAEAERLARFLQGKDPVPSERLAALCSEWAEPLSRLEWTPAQVEEACALAERVAVFFHQEKPDGLAETARALQGSSLPMEVKLSIFRFARTYDAPAAPGGWESIEFKLPDQRQKFHYSVQLPSNYRPDRRTPVMLSLHGQHGKAEDMNRFWGKTAEKYGFVLIGPEYIYGRASGLRFSVEEHRAVMGALQDAASRWNLDLDAVFLQGHSQGGNASWEIGGAHASTFAGVVPMVGVSCNNEVLGGFQDTALYAIDGSLDGEMPARNRQTIQALGRLECDAMYVEYQGRAHEAFQEEYDAVCLWMRQRCRPAGQDRLTLMPHVTCDARRDWVEIISTSKPLPERNSSQPAVATGEAKAEENQITVTTRGVLSLRVYFNPAVVDLSKKVTILANGKRVFQDTVKPDWSFALKSSFDRRDRQEVFLGQTTFRP